MRMVIGVLLISLLVMSVVWCLGGESTNVKKFAVWVVPYDHVGRISVNKGDVIELWTSPLPVIPDNLDVEIRVTKQGQGIQQIGHILPSKEGTMERIYYFKAFNPGLANLKVELINEDGAIRKTWTYEVDVRPQPSTNPT